MLFGAMLQLAKHERGDFRRRELAIGDADADDAAGLTADPERQQIRVAADIVDAAPHEPLHRVDRARWRRQQAALCLAADEDRPVFADGGDRGHKGIAALVADDHRHAVIDVGHKAVGGAEIDTDDLTHGSPRPSRAQWWPTGC